MYLEPDGTFPNHEANPLKTETLVDLQARVREVGADFGFALDGDCDRIGVVDNEGNVVEASYIGALIGLEVLQLNPGAKMLYDLRSSLTVPELWQASGAHVDKTMVGHANIKRQMREVDAVFASELSLHLYYRDMNYLESTDLSFLDFLRLVSHESRTVAEIIAPMKTYAHSGEYNFEVEDKDGKIAEIKEKYASASVEVSELDGLWMSFDWGWFNVRKSNTDPVLRLNLEAKTEESMKEKLEELSAEIQK